MEWILPVLVETRSVHQDILADRQAIAQAQAASQTFHEQLLALAHSTEMGIHQLQQELLSILAGLKCLAKLDFQLLRHGGSASCTCSNRR